MSEHPPRIFIASSAGLTLASSDDAVANMGISPAVSAAYDLLTDDGMPAGKVAELVMGAERSGRDPEAFARHMLKLRRAMRATK